MKKRYDGIYFTTKNFVPLKFIKLGDKTHYDAIDFFTNSKGRFREGLPINNIYEFTETVTNKYLLNDIIKTPNGTYALFGTSYGSKNNAVLTRIDDLLTDTDKLYDKAISDINVYFKSNIITINSNLIEYKKDKLYIIHDDARFYFVSPWLKQIINCDKVSNIWGNGYEWKYYKPADELNNLSLKRPVLINNNEIGKYRFMGWKENLLLIYNLSLNEITDFDTPLTENQLTLNINPLSTINFNTLLPNNNTSETIIDKQQSKDIGQRTCEVCAGTGFIPDRVRNGYISTFQMNPLSGGPVKCFNCNGSGKYTLVTGEYEKKNIVMFDKWSLKDVSVCNSNKIVIVFETNKRTFLQESRAGYLTNGQLTSNEKVFFSFIIDENGNVMNSIDKDFGTIEKTNAYAPIYSGE